MNLRGIDLNLFTVFEVVYEEGNQQRAAERLGMTQPAVSSAMSRLRDAIREELFIPSPRGVTATTAADRLYSQLEPAMQIIRQAVEGGQAFDPKEMERTFRVATGYASAALGSIGALLQWLSKEAPGIRLAIEAAEDPQELPRKLRVGAIDFIADYARYDDDELHHEVVLHQALVAIARKGHPRIDGRLTKKQFVEERHVIHQEDHPQRQAPRLRDVDSSIAYRADIEVGNALAIPIIVSQTDLIAVTTEKIARFFSKPFALQVLELPVKLPPIPVFLIWHRSRERDPGHAWMREGIRRVMQTSVL